ncbi:MAG: hypothetical protein IPN26_17710 [Bacteroidetes bacterium]|nr:hypothetical protein [Bacteroidota bacterium]
MFWTNSLITGIRLLEVALRDTIPFFTEYGGAYPGFVYQPTNPGLINQVTISNDQDWIGTSVNVTLMENMLFHLLSSNSFASGINPIWSLNTASGNLLEWTTQYRKNNARFNVERSRDESLSFEKLDLFLQPLVRILKAIILLDPAPWPGINYYHLKQMDLDGKWTCSKTISIDNSRDELIVFPNPPITKSGLDGKANQCLPHYKYCRTNLKKWHRQRR